jgi:uncharacterized coiled-coil protein SlyX
MEGTMFGNRSRELEAQVAEQAKTIAKLSDDLLKIQGEFEALHIVVNVVIVAIGRLRRRERDAIIAELKNALGRGLGFELTNLSTDKRQVVNNAFSALLQNVIEIHKGDKSQPPSAPQRS